MTSSLHEELAAAANNALASVGFVYDEASGLYMDQNSGYTYNPETNLYFDSYHQCFYTFNETLQEYEFYQWANEATQLYSTSDYAKLQTGEKEKEEKEKEEGEKQIEFHEPFQATTTSTKELDTNNNNNNNNSNNSNLSLLEQERRKVLASLKRSLLGTTSLEQPQKQLGKHVSNSSNNSKNSSSVSSNDTDQDDNKRAKKVRLDSDNKDSSTSNEETNGEKPSSVYIDRALLRRQRNAHHRESFESPVSIKMNSSTPSSSTSKEEIADSSSSSNNNNNKNKKLDQSNKGFQMLEKMNWKEGQTLGVQNGLIEPIVVEKRAERTGLGYSSLETTSTVSSPSHLKLKIPYTPEVLEKLQQRYNKSGETQF